MATRYDDVVEVTESAVERLTSLRPQRFAIVRSDEVINPIVEPQWTGIRVLAGVEDGRADVRDEDGDPFSERPEIAPALVRALRAQSAIFDGFVTKQTAGEIVYTTPPADVPSVGQLLMKPFFGIRRDRQKEAEQEREHLVEAATFRDDEGVAFVATDLLWLDGQSLLDVPLLERKRLLDSVIEPSDLVRIGMYVRPPLQTWISTWRRLGFIGLSYRAANSRYHPGEERNEWTLLSMPRR